MPNLETKDELFEVFEESAKKIASATKDYWDAQKILDDIFTMGIKHIGIDGKETVSTPEERAGMDEATFYTMLYGKGQHCLNEIVRPGGATQFMTWFVKQRGISLKDILEIRDNPNSAKAVDVKNQLEILKHEYHEFANSGDIEKYADFFMGSFKQYNKISKIVVNSGDAKSLADNWPVLSEFIGSTSLIQQSLEVSGNQNEAQVALTEKINEKIKKKISPDLELRDVLASMQAIHLMGFKCENGLKNPEAFEAFKKDPDYRENLFNKMISIIRPFNLMQNAAKKQSLQGKQLTVIDKEIGKASAIAIFDVPGLDKQFYPSLLNENNGVYLNELRCFAGNKNCIPMHNLKYATSYAHDGSETHYDQNENPIFGKKASPLTVGTVNLTQFIDADKFTEILDGNEYISTIVRRKMKANEPLTHEEIVVFMSPENPNYDKIQSDISTFFSGDPAVRVNKFSSELKYVLSSMCEQDYGVSIADFVAGKHNIIQNCQEEYNTHIRDFKNGKANSPVDLDFHKKISTLLSEQLETVSPTILSSKEFSEFYQACRELKNPDSNYPIGHEAEYKKQLANIMNKAKAYTNAKAAGGKKERITGRGQKRYNIALRFEAFAKESLKQIEGAEAVKAMYFAKATAKEFNVDEKIAQRIDDLLGPKAKGSEELAAKKVYVTTQKMHEEHPNLSYYIPEEITLPEKCPYTDHEFALISYAEIADFKNVKELCPHKNPMLSDELNARTSFTFSHEDLFFSPRGETANDINSFNICRHSAERDIKSYMNGDPKPLASVLGKNIKYTLKHITGINSASAVVRGNVKAARDCVNLLLRDPKLFMNSGLNQDEIEKLIAREAQIKVDDDAKIAQNKLTTDKNLSAEEKKNCVASIIASSVIEQAEANTTDAFTVSPEMQKLNNAYQKIHKAFVNTRFKLHEHNNGTKKLSAKEVSNLTKKMDEYNIKKENIYAKLSLVSEEHGLNDILKAFTNPRQFEKSRIALIDTIKSSPDFEKIMKGEINYQDKIKDITEFATIGLAQKLQSPVEKVQEINAPVKNDLEINVPAIK